MPRLPAVVQLSAGTAALAIAPGVAGVMAARSLGATGRGDLAVALAVATIAGSFGLRGLDTALLAHGDSAGAGGTTGDTGAVKRSIVLRRGALVIVLEGLVAAFVFAAVQRDLPIVAMISIVWLAAATTHFLLTRALNLAAGRSTRALRADLVASGVLLIAATVVTVVGPSVEAYVTIAAAALTAGSIVGVEFAGRVANAEHGVADVRRRLSEVSRPAWTVRTMQAAAFRSDRIVLAAFAGSGAAGIYAAVVPFAEMATIVPLHLTQLVTAEVRDADGTVRWGDTAAARSAIAVGLVAAVVVFVFSGPLVDVLYGDEFAAGVSALRILIVASFVSVLWRLNESELFGRRATRGAVVATAVAAIVVVVGTAVLSDLGADAAAIASLVGYVAAAGISAAFLRGVRRG